jgi:hypothetical protein
VGVGVGVGVTVGFTVAVGVEVDVCVGVGVNVAVGVGVVVDAGVEQAKANIDTNTQRVSQRYLLEIPFFTLPTPFRRIQVRSMFCHSFKAKRPFAKLLLPC